ncbi:hypothetical protein DERP_009041, partial [Dermatophagoides pteronyssinus]
YHADIRIIFCRLLLPNNCLSKISCICRNKSRDKNVVTSGLIKSGRIKRLSDLYSFSKPAISSVCGRFPFDGNTRQSFICFKFSVLIALNFLTSPNDVHGNFVTIISPSKRPFVSNTFIRALVCNSCKRNIITCCNNERKNGSSINENPASIIFSNVSRLKYLNNRSPTPN